MPIVSMANQAPAIDDCRNRVVGPGGRPLGDAPEPVSPGRWYGSPGDGLPRGCTLGISAVSSEDAGSSMRMPGGIASTCSASR
jgi:hypothetical protein